MEIERKWLIKADNIPYDLEKLEHFEIEQAYISFSPTVRIRRINSERFILTVKSKPIGNSFAREEFEMDIAEKEYFSLLKKAEGRLIHKTRYLNRREDGLLEEIDIFSGGFNGLAYLEIEFSDEKEAKDFVQPQWVERDVTNEKGFSNGALARNGMPEI